MTAPLAALLTLLLVFLPGIAQGAAPGPALDCQVSWLGNSFGGASNRWVQNFFIHTAVQPDDLLTGITAHRRKDGEYLVFVEEDYRAKVLLYRWKP